MHLPPAKVLLAWPQPNYEDPVMRNNAVLIVDVITITIAFLVTCLRLVTRFWVTCTPGLDDFFIVVALTFAIGMCVATSMATEDWGWKRHIWDIPYAWLPTVQKLNLSFQTLFSVSSSFTKLSVLWFCKRLIGAGAKGLYRTYFWVLVASQVFVGICCILFEFLSIFQCRPVKAFWEVEPKYPHTCLHDGSLVFAASVVNILTDFMCTVLPMPLIWNLKLPARQRLAVMSIFGLGIIVNVAGSIRTAYVYKSMIATYDATWSGWPVFLSAAVEINIGLTCASAPALRPLLASVIPHILQTTRQYAYSSSKRASKLWSTGPSKLSNMGASNVATVYTEAERGQPFEVLRTVEMETWSEAMNKTNNVANTYNVSSSHTRAPSDSEKLDLKSGEIRHNSVPSTLSQSESSGTPQPKSPTTKEF